MFFISIDASTKSTGIQLFNNNHLIKYDCLTSNKKDPIDRIMAMISKIESFMKENKEYKIEKIILEEVFQDDNNSNKSLKTKKALMYLQAAINFYFHINYKDIEIKYFYPNEWRSICGIHTGRGIEREQLKQEDIKKVNKIFDIEITNDDIQDAILIGYAYITKPSDDEMTNW